MYYDDLPIWGFVGKLEAGSGGAPDKYSLFTHIHFEVKHAGGRVVQVDISTDPARTLDITADPPGTQPVAFTYSVAWAESAVPWERRMDKYAKYSFLPQHLEIHWFSIVNSCVTVLLLTAFLATILMRVLKNDFVKFSRDDEAMEEQEETGARAAGRRGRAGWPAREGGRPGGCARPDTRAPRWQHWRLAH